jgi:hypothetical protein
MSVPCMQHTKHLHRDLRQTSETRSKEALGRGVRAPASCNLREIKRRDRKAGLQEHEPAYRQGDKGGGVTVPSRDVLDACGPRYTMKVRVVGLSRDWSGNMKKGCRSPIQIPGGLDWS